MRLFALIWLLGGTLLVLFGFKEEISLIEKFFMIMFTIFMPMLLGYEAGKEQITK